uniref:Uncharacterized protein n=1 Tax=Nelumbo nucifera TaxID=4432 RepID=A0A822Z2Q7_NELNU|nr:TPA_asm: hypothetical protein HUJ06_008366 [Nelumbo nucifera]
MISSRQLQEDNAVNIFTSQIRERRRMKKQKGKKQYKPEHREEVKRIALSEAEQKEAYSWPIAPSVRPCFSAAHCSQVGMTVLHYICALFGPFRV